eukprot:9477395-Pyramimonas_sp.AAC.1
MRTRRVRRWPSATACAQGRPPPAWPSPRSPPRLRSRCSPATCLSPAAARRESGIKLEMSPPSLL